MIKVTLLFDYDGGGAHFEVQGSPATAEEIHAVLSNAHHVLDKALEPLREGYDSDANVALGLYEIWSEIETASRQPQ